MSFIQSKAFNALKAIIRGTIITPSDALYQKSLERWSKLAEKPAGAVIFVRTNEDVSEVIRFAVEHKVDLAIKGKLTYSDPRFNC